MLPLLKTIEEWSAVTKTTVPSICFSDIILFLFLFVVNICFSDILFQIYSKADLWKLLQQVFLQIGCPPTANQQY